MTSTQRILALALSGALLLGGFAIGRVTDTPKTSAEENQLVSNRTASATSNLAGENQTLYLSDYRAGYTDGYNSCQDNRGAANVVHTGRVGYNDGYKDGFADAYRGRTGQEVSSAYAPITTHIAPIPVSYRSGVYRERTRLVYRERTRRRGSKLRTALTIAAPAAIGAGIGLVAGGKKGAGVGALLGGGGGALYHLFRDRR
jgi:hypothetical protein